MADYSTRATHAAIATPIYNPGETRLTYACLFFYLGVHLAPCRPGTKEFLAGYGPYKNYITDEIDLWKYFQEGNYNYAVLTGTGPGLIAVDFDDLDLYQRFAAEYEDNLAQTFTVLSHRGAHVYYRADDLRGWKGKGFEVMGLHRAVMGPLSVHPTGDIYTPLTRPYIRKIESLAGLPIFDAPPEPPSPPAIRPPHLGGGLVHKLKEQHPIFETIQSRPGLAQRIRLHSSDGGRGRWFTGYCPFHEDKKPSFWIDTERNLYGCRACDAKGDVLNLIAFDEGKDLAAVLDELRGAL